MKFYEKTVKYFKFFEDAKTIEVDSDYNRLAVVFFGKDNLIHIFDTKPYLEYMPIMLHEPESVSNNKASKKSSFGEKNMKKREKYNSKNISDIFNDIQKNNNEKKTNIEEANKTVIENSQEYIIFNNFNSNTKNDFQIDTASNIQLDYSKAPKYEKDVSFGFFKPKLKSHLLSIISSPSNIIIGLKWFSTTQVFNGQENSKMLLSVNDDGNIYIYAIKSSDYDICTTINMTKLQFIPFETFPEQWKSISQIFTGKPIKDFYMSSFPNRLYTLHLDNYITSWQFTVISGRMSFMPCLSINLTPSLPANNILVDNKNNLIYTFHNDSFNIFKIMDKPPYYKMFTSNFINFEMEKSILESQKKKKPRDKKNNISDNFIDYYEEDEFKFDDVRGLCDKSEVMQIFDMNLFFSVQKPEFTIAEEFIIWPYFRVNKKEYILFKFKNKFFVENCFTDITLFTKCIQGEMTDLVEILMSSSQPITFCQSPSFYIQLNEDIEADKILELELTVSFCKERYYQPIAISNNNNLLFFDLHNNQTKISYEFINPRNIQNDYLNLHWVDNNTILSSSTRYMFNMIKFCNELASLGIPINPQNLLEQFKEEKAEVTY